MLVVGIYLNNIVPYNVTEEHLNNVYSEMKLY